MAKTYITTATTTQVSGPCKKMLITVNNSLTGTIGVIDGDSGTTVNTALITNPTSGNRYEYWNFAIGARIVTSATCDITVNTDGSYGNQ